MLEVGWHRSALAAGWSLDGGAQWSSSLARMARWIFMLPPTGGRWRRATLLQSKLDYIWTCSSVEHMFHNLLLILGRTDPGKAVEMYTIVHTW